MNDQPLVLSGNKVTIRACLLDFLKTLPSGTKFTDVSSEALDLAEEEVLTEIKRLCGATSVTVATTTENSGGGGDFFCIDSFALNFADGSTIDLYDVDAQDAQDNDDLLIELAPRLGDYSEASLEAGEFDDALRDKVDELYGLLNDLPRLRGLKGGETIYKLPSA